MPEPLRLDATERAVLTEIALALRSIRYGQLQVTIHDSRVVEIATTEKKRLGDP